jgi:hypothetical protein
LQAEKCGHAKRRPKTMIDSHEPPISRETNPPV